MARRGLCGLRPGRASGAGQRAERALPEPAVTQNLGGWQLSIRLSACPSSAGRLPDRPLDQHGPSGKRTDMRAIRSRPAVGASGLTSSRCHRESSHFGSASQPSCWLPTLQIASKTQNMPVLFPFSPKPPIVRAALEFTIHRAVLLPKSEEDLEMGFWTHAESVNSSADRRTLHRSPSGHATAPSRREQPDISNPDLRCAVRS